MALGLYLALFRLAVFQGPIRSMMHVVLKGSFGVRAYLLLAGTYYWPIRSWTAFGCSDQDCLPAKKDKSSLSSPLFTRQVYRCSQGVHCWASQVSVRILASLVVIESLETYVTYTVFVRSHPQGTKGLFIWKPLYLCSSSLQGLFVDKRYVMLINLAMLTNTIFPLKA